MRIAVNGKAFGRRARGGAIRAALQLVEWIGRERPDFYLDVYAPGCPADSESLGLRAGNIRLRASRGPFYGGGFGRSAWEQARLPSLVRSGADILLLYEGEVITSRTRALVLCLFLFTTLLATASSTALIGIGLGFALLLLFLFSPLGVTETAGPGKRRAGRIVGVAVLMILLLPAVFLALARFALGLQTGDIAQAIDLLMFEKLGSTSGLERGQGAFHGLALFGDRPLLGVGWGSNRTYDLFTNLLATTGILGLATFVAAHLSLWRGLLRLWWRLNALGARATARMPAVLLLALTVALLAKSFAEPGIAYLDYWLVFGLVLSSLGWPNVSRTSDAPQFPEHGERV